MKKEKSGVMENTQKTGVVYYTVHVYTPYVYKPKLYIKNISETLTPTELQNMLNEAGYVFQEFGIAWANHTIRVGLKEAHYSIRTGFLKAQELGIEVVEYEELKAKVKDAQNIN